MATTTTKQVTFFLASGLASLLVLSASAQPATGSAAPAAGAPTQGWLMLDKPTVAINDEVALAWWSGHKLVGKQRAFARASVARLEHWSTVGGVGLLSVATEGAAPLLRTRLQSEGGHLFVLDTQPVDVEVESVAFSKYLQDEGQQRALAARQRKQQHHQPGRLRHSEHHKTIVQVGAKRDETFKRVVGQALELVAQVDPTSIKPAPNARLEVALQLDGKPLPYTQVTAYCLRRGTNRVRTVVVKTRQSGSTSIPINFDCNWLLRSAHVEACNSCNGADWRGYQASLQWTGG